MVHFLPKLCQLYNYITWNKPQEGSCNQTRNKPWRQEERLPHSNHSQAHCRPGKPLVPRLVSMQYIPLAYIYDMIQDSVETIYFIYLCPHYRSTACSFPPIYLWIISLSWCHIICLSGDFSTNWDKITWRTYLPLYLSIELLSIELLMFPVQNFLALNENKCPSINVLIIKDLVSPVLCLWHYLVSWYCKLYPGCRSRCIVADQESTPWSLLIRSPHDFTSHMTKFHSG